MVHSRSRSVLLPDEPRYEWSEELPQWVLKQKFEEHIKRTLYQPVPKYIDDWGDDRDVENLADDLGVDRLADDLNINQSADSVDDGGMSPLWRQN
jgi:hypothetical protein